MPPATPTPKRRGLLVGLLTGVVAVAFESVAVATAMPRAGVQLGQLGLYAWAFTLFVLGMVLSTVLAGRLADRVGPTRPLIIGYVLFLIGLVLSGTATSMLALVIGRFVQGIGGGAINLTLMVVVALAFDEDVRPAIMTAFSFCWVLPALLGPFIAGWITDQFSWHWVFGAIIPFVIVAMVLVIPALLKLDRAGVTSVAGAGSTAASKQRPAPIWAALAAAAGAAAVQLAGQHGGVRGLMIAVAALALLAIGVPPLMPRGFFRVGAGLSAVVWTRALQAGAFFASESFLPLMLVEQRGLTLTRAGLALTIGSLGWTFGSWLQSRPNLRWGRHTLIVTGTLSQFVGVGLLCLFAWHPGWTMLIPGLGWTLCGVGMGLGVVSSALATMTLSDADNLGRNSSSLQVGDGLGNALCAGAAGSLFHWLHATHALHITFGSLYLVTFAASVLAVAASLRIGRIGQ